jgi:hypothetical protein
MPEQHSDHPPAPAPAKLDIDWLKTAAGALAAVTTAVLLSTLGAVGTLVGAALGSVAATVGSALYAQGLSRSKNAMLKAQETALHKVGIAQAEVRRAGRRTGAQHDAHLDLADERLGEAREELDVVEPPPATWRERVAALGWRRVAVLAVATFAVVLVAITGFEALSGRSLSSWTGGSSSGQGTTLGGVADDAGGSGKPGKQDQPKPSPSGFESPSGSDTPSQTPSGTPSETPSETPSGTPTESPAPTEVPTPSSSPSAPVPSGTPTATP